MIKIKKILFEKNNNFLKNVTQNLNLDGAIIIDSFVKRNNIENLKKEFHKVLKKYKYDIHFEDVPGTKMAKIYLNSKSFNTFKIEFPLISKCIKESNNIEEKNISFKTHNLFIYTHLDDDKLCTNTRWHMDPTDEVKYFLTLGDVTKDNGPTLISIGSHHDAVYRYSYRNKSSIIKKAWSNGGTIFRDESLISNIVSTTRSAGDLLVFRTSTFHKASKISANQSRMCIRWWWEPKIPKNIFYKIYFKLKAGIYKVIRYFTKEQELNF